jgi:hypothetical protein
MEPVMRRSAILVHVSLFFLAALPSAHATDFDVETLLTGLSNPRGVAVRPSESAARYEIFFADTGAGRVVRLWNDEPKSSVDVITGFARLAPSERSHASGPVALLFLNRRHLVVGVGDEAGAQLQLFDLTDETASVPADKAKQSVAISSGDNSPDRIFTIARTRANEAVRDALMLICSDSDAKGNLWTTQVRGDTLGRPEPFPSAEQQIQFTSSASVAVGESGYVAIASGKCSNEKGGSRLSFYNPINGSRVMELTTPLCEIVCLAYNPRTGDLYAADTGGTDSNKGGVFRLDAASEPDSKNCAAVKITDIDRPSSLAFGPDGALYVTAHDESNDAASHGILLRITGDM